MFYNLKEFTGTVLEGEEEANYWAEFNKAKVNKAQREHDKKQMGKGKKEKQRERQSRKRRADKGQGHGKAGQSKGKVRSRIYREKLNGKFMKKTNFDQFQRTVFNDDEDDEGEEDDEQNGNSNGQNGEGEKVADETDEPVGAKKPKVEEEEA
jgi:hypothetical protein